MNQEHYKKYIEILKEELVPAMGCTEPIALAYCGAIAKKVLGSMPTSIKVRVSGNILKNVKSVIVPNTNGQKGIEAAVAAGVVCWNADLKLEVISQVSDEKKQQLDQYLKTVDIEVESVKSDEVLDIRVYVKDDQHNAYVRIAREHSLVCEVIKDDEVLYHHSLSHMDEEKQKDRSFMSVEEIVEFADCVQITEVKDILERQIEYNLAIAKEGFNHNYGANIGKVLLKHYGNDVKTKARAYAASGSDARMSGCEMPVIINSGSGNQGMTASLPVIVYAQELQVSHEKLLRALVISNLITIHLKTGIGRLSAYCGVVSAGAGAGSGIAYLHGGDFRAIAHTIVNALAIVSGMICDGAKPSCAGKIASSVDAGILGYKMYIEGQQFYGGDGIISKGVENTIRNIGRLGSDGMKETDEEIIRIMLNC